MTEHRRYIFKLYPTAEQAARLHEQRMMMADLWNALKQRYEDIQSRTVQRQVWLDRDGKRHAGLTIHSPTWESIRCKNGERVVIPPDKSGRPKLCSKFDLQNEITFMLNELPEWRALSCWSAHRTAESLINAFDAFYRRAKGGAGKQSGYPRYKRRDRHEGIPHRFASGCKLAKDDRHERSWRLILKGVPDEIHARGAFPVPVEGWTHADVIWRDQKWWVSVCVDVPARRFPGRQPVRIEFDLIDCLARVNGIAEIPPGLVDAQRISAQLDDLCSERDQRWPRGKRLCPEERTALQEANGEITRLSAYVARIRKNALHVWTARLVAHASDLTMVVPNLRENTRSPRGDERSWGACVETVSELNRNTLSLSAGMAVQFLTYKAQEAGIRCVVVNDEAPMLAVGGDLVHTGKQVRRSRRHINEERKLAA